MHPDHLQNMQEQVALAYVASKVIEFIKNSKHLPFINQHSDQINRALSWFLAMATTAGIQVGFTGSLLEGGVLQVTIPSLETLVQFGLNTVFQHALQKGSYHGLIKPRST